MDWKQELSDLLSAYFSDQDINEGAEELAFAGINDPTYHEHVNSVLRAASHAAAEAGDLAAMETINASHAAFVDDAAEAKMLIDSMRAAYQRAYDEFGSDAERN